MVPLCGYSKLCLVWVLCFYSRKWNPCFISGWPRLVIQVKEVSVVQGLLWEGGVWGDPSCRVRNKTSNPASGGSAEEKGGRLYAQHSPDVKVRLIIIPFMHTVCHGPLPAQEKA